MLLLRPRGGDSHLQNVHEENNTTWTQLVESSAYRYDPKMRTHCARNSKRFSHLYVFLQVSSCDQFWRRLCNGTMGTGCFLRRSKCLQGAEMCRIIYVLFLPSKNASAQVRKKQVGWPQFQTQPLQCSSSERRDHAGPSSAGPRALPRLKLPRNEAPGPPSCPGSQCFSQPSMAPWRLPGLTTKAVGAKGCALLLSPRGKLLVELAGAWWREVQYPWGNPLSPFFRGI